MISKVNRRFFLTTTRSNNVSHGDYNSADNVVFIEGQKLIGLVNFVRIGQPRQKKMES